MNFLPKIPVALSLMLSFTACHAQIKNTQIESVKIFGNCEMCEKTIEKAGTENKVTNVDWNVDTKMATITFDRTKTNKEEILKRIALAGYDSNEFLAPDDAYAKLPGCCKYERLNKTLVTEVETIESYNMHSHKTVEVTTQEVNQLKIVFDSYFNLKDALIKSDSKAASATAKELLAALNQVKMEKLTADEHMVWMHDLSNLKSSTEKIVAATSIVKQRNEFMGLSKSIFELAKVATHDAPMYYQNCPMYNDGKGANWLSRENAVKNPYYGSQMLTCGKTIETIK